MRSVVRSVFLGMVAAMEELPVTYRISARAAADELDYADMVALAEMFQRWSLDEPGISPADRTKLAEYSADYERLAEWVGFSWKASQPSDRQPVMRLLARLERKGA